MHMAAKVAILIAIVAGGGVVALRLERPAAAGPPAPRPVPVVVAPVRQQDVPILLTGLGTVRALNMATIRTQVTGKLQAVDFVEGQTVHRGDRLAQIDPRPYQAKLEQTQAQLSHDHAQMSNMEVNLNRNLPLLRSGFATDQQVTDQKSQIEQLQATAKSDQAAIDDAQTMLSYTTLTAPFDGISGVRRIDVGNIVHPTDANGLVTIAQVQPIAVLFTLPAADIAQVQAALAAGPLSVVAYDQAGTHVLDTGKLLLVNNEADPQSGTVQLKALFPNVERRLWPGTFVNVEVTTSVAKGALTVPTNSVQEGPNGPFIFVVGNGSKVAMQTVQLGQQSRGTTVVNSGLSLDSTVVTQGQYRLAAGTPVTASSPADVPGSSAATSGLLP